jgi:hypothetical protein
VLWLLFFGLLLLSTAGGWRRWAPDARPRGWLPLYVELLGVAVIVVALWRFPMARWFGLIAAIVMILAAGFRALRSK